MAAKLPFNMDDLFEDENIENMNVIETMTNVMKVQQQGALELTKLVIEHCKETEITKNYIFDVFEEAMNCIRLQLNKDDDES